MSIILIDCDGVLLNWRDPFDAWMMREHGIYANGDVRMYDQAIRYDIPREEIMPYILHCDALSCIYVSWPGQIPPCANSTVAFERRSLGITGCK